ncbi:MAG: 5'-methylthioadenosine nucleosidase [Pseudomonadota bacterium]
MSDIVIFVALADEFAGPVPDGMVLVHTGVGKVNAALAAAAALVEHKPFLAINYGTAGGLTIDHGGLIECGATVQRDMDLRPLGLALGTTFGDEEPPMIRWAEGPVVGTGDSFADGPPELASDLVDMEAYALAKACHRHGVAFRCVKYVSDSADDGAADDWQDNKMKGARRFAEWLTAL